MKLVNIRMQKVSSERVHRVGDRRCHTEEARDVPIPIDERALVRVIFTKFLL